MAGLVAAARARELGAGVVVHEKGDRPGGSMYLSSCVVWRYRDFERFREECPGGDPDLQHVVWEGLDDALAWLESLGAPVVTRETDNPLTSGVRFDPQGLTEALARGAGDVRLGQPLAEIPDGVAVVLATGGFQGDADLVREHITPEALAQVYARHARVENLRGEVYEARTWSEIDVVQWTARQPGARARYVVSDDALAERVRERTVGEVIEAARAAGGPVERRDGETAVEVVAGITTTLGGIAIDPRGRAADGLWVAGADAGGISTGGWSSALASALVLGKIAAEDALSGL
jgi:hypothetical protein